MALIMAMASEYLVAALRKAADNIEAGERYSWAHMGACNCGHLAQVITGLSAADIHKRALEKEGNWTQQSENFTSYCPQTGFNIDYLVSSLIEAGLGPTDIRDLEFLSDLHVLRRLPGGFRYLSRNLPEDVVCYIRTWAGLLEEKLQTRKTSCTVERSKEAHVLV